MNKDILAVIVKDPSLVSGEKHAKSLKTLLRRYPYFTIAQMLYAAALVEQKNKDAAKQLQVAAAYVADKEKLYEILNPCPVSEWDDCCPVKPAEPEKTEAEVSQATESTLAATNQPEADLPSEDVSSDNTAEETSATVETTLARPETTEEKEAEVVVATPEQPQQPLGEPESKEEEPLQTSAGNEETPVNSATERSSDELRKIIEARLSEIGGDSAKTEEPEAIVPDTNQQSAEEVVVEVDFSSAEENTPTQQPETPSEEVSAQESKVDMLLRKFEADEIRTTPPTKEELEEDFSKLVELPEDVANLSEEDLEKVVSETLAQYCEEQEYYEKAIRVYEILQTKFPEKSELFSQKIDENKDKLNKSKN